MKEKFLNATIATILVITLTMANFIILGVNVVTYASELLHQTSETNYKNVEFTTYFKTDTGDKIDMAQTPINTEGLKLYMQVAVKEEGYFQGIIEISNNNFTLDTNKTSNAINKIDGNIIALNQINAGQTVEIEVGINSIKDNSIDQGLLSAITNVNLKGTYVSNKEKQTPIDSTKNVQLILLNPYTDEQKAMKLSSEVITNKLYSVEEKDSETNNTVKVNKRMVQVKVRSGLQGNQYPIKNTNLKLTIPEGVEKVEVSSQGTKATNGRTSLAWEQVDNTLDVKIENTPSEDNKIAWSKSGEDVVVVTYILPENVNVAKTNIDIADEIQLYDTKETKITGNTTTTVLEEKDGTVEFEETSSESIIYKGKIYTKEDRKIKTNTNIYINYEEQTEKINVQEKIAKYTGTNELNANVQYQMTSLDKDQFTKLFGENGYIIISDENKNTIASITNDAQTDENGNVVINYPDNVKVLNIETSKPISKGRINLKHIKTIKNDGYSRDIIRNVNGLKQEIIATYNKENKIAQTNIELKETDTKASLSINNNTISTQRETNIEMRATLKANKEDNDLFKNPTVRIQLPQEVTNVEVSNISLLYEEELKIRNARYDKASKTIVIEMQGEQTKYHTDVNEGAQIYISAKVSADELTPSKKSEILFTYSNENSISGQKTSKLPVKIESKYGLMLYTKALNYNNSNEAVKTIDSQVPVAKLDVNSNAKTATMNMAVLNNYGTALTNIEIVGRIPNKAVSEGTLDTTLAQQIKTNIEGAKVYYSADASAKAQDNTWTENAQNLNAVKSYKIVLDTMQPETALKFAYTFTIPEKLDYNQIVNSNFDVNYIYVGEQMNASSGVQFKTQEKKLVQHIQNDASQRTRAQTVRETVTEQGLKVETKITKSGGKDQMTLTEGMSVYEGDTLHYTVKVSNNTGADINNVKATVTQTNAVFYGKVTKKVEAVDIYTGEVETVEETIYDKMENDKLEYDIKNIENGKYEIFEYEIIVKEVEGEDKTTQGNIKIAADNIEEQDLSTIQLKIIQGTVELIYKPVMDYQEGAGILKMALSIKNISNNTIHEIPLEFQIQDPKLFIEYEIEGTEEEAVAVQENSVKYKINKDIAPGESTEMGIIFSIANFEDEEVKNAEIYCLATLDGVTYSSGTYKTQFNKNTVWRENPILKISQESMPKDGTIIKHGDTVTYILNVENTGTIEDVAESNFELPINMDIQNITLIQNNKEQDITEAVRKATIEENKENEDEEEDLIETKDNWREFNVDVKLNPSQAAKVKVTAKVEDESIENNEEITNTIEVVDSVVPEALTTNAVTYYGKGIPSEEEQKNPANNNQNGNNGNSNNQSSINNNSSNNNDNYTNQNITTYTISGTVWKDENKNGTQDDNSSNIGKVEIRAINEVGEFATDSRNKIINTYTTSNGSYKLELPKGKYMLVFIYDTDKYALTNYSEDQSCAVDKELEINGKRSKVAVTNEINLNKDVKDIDVGLIEKENFSLSLQKSVNKVTVQNKGGTKSYNYAKGALAKVEIRAKHFSGTNLIVEYNIDVTNNGEIDGYLNDVVDYIPEGYKFSSEMNSSWYESTDKHLHNNSLANEKISAGETKTLKLVLTKTLTENDTGLVVNTAEIANSTSVTGSSDVNSTANNKASGEDDISSANLLVSVSTGIKTACIIGIVVSLVLVGLCVYMIKRGEGE